MTKNINENIIKQSKITSSAADRALKEAKERNKIKNTQNLPKEVGGRQGPEPTRFGDWEKKGIICDF